MLAGSQARLRSSEKINKILAMSDSDEEELDKEAVGKKVEYISLSPPAWRGLSTLVFR